MNDPRPLLLYVTDSEGLGGAEGYLRTLLLHVDQKCYRVALALPPRQATRPLVDLVRAHGIEVIALDLVHRDGLDVGGVVRSATLLQRLRPAIIHFVLASPRRCAETVLAAALVGVRRRLITFQLVTPIPRFNRLAGALRGLNRRIQYRTVHHGVAVSDGNRRLLATQYGFPAKRLTFIANGVDTEQFVPCAADESLRAHWDVPPGVPLIGVVGRLSRQKGHTVLFDALPQVWATHPTAHIVLAGAGELEESLRAQAAKIDLLGRIHFIGQQHNMPQVLAALDLFVLPSLYEGLAFAVLEAMAMARPIVASSVDGTAEALSHGQTGLLVPPGEPAPLAEAIVRVLDDSTLAVQMGQAARDVAQRRFSQRQMLDSTFALYE
jgi:glycosyltransferase involved in cell wall biosynthesis